MSATSRLEKHKGVTLWVRDDLLSIVLDGTGYTFEGPVTDDEHVKRIARLVIPTLLAVKETNA